MSALLAVGILAVEPESDELDSRSGGPALQDGVVTPEEYRQANDAVVRCGKGKNVDFSAEDRHGIVIFSSSNIDDVEVLNECDSGYLARVRSIYEDWYKNPRMGGDEVYYECLAAVGLISPSDAARAEPLSQLIDRLMRNAASPEQSMLADRCMYDPIGRSWKSSPATTGASVAATLSRRAD